MVQVYAQLQRRRITRPVRELVGFDRVSLCDGETGTVTFFYFVQRSYPITTSIWTLL
jgi:hypothetical protein